jgi:hypothetical protein
MNTYDSELSNISSLNQQYNNTLITYQNAYKKYIQLLSENKKGNYISLENSSYYSDQKLISEKANSIGDCQNLCQKNVECTGATFNSDQGSCLAYGGDGYLIPSSNSTSYSIITPLVKQSSFLKQLNFQLLMLNDQIMNKLNNSYSINQKMDHANDEKKNILEKNKNYLQEERIKIDNLIQQYEFLDEARDNNQIEITQYQYSYYIMIFIVFILLSLLVRYGFMNNIQQGGSSFKKHFSSEAFFLAALMIVFLGSSHIYSNMMVSF